MPSVRNACAPRRSDLSLSSKSTKIVEEIDASDRGRIKKYYGLRMRAERESEQDREDGLADGREDGWAQDFDSEVQSLDPTPPKFGPRTPVRTSVATSVNADKHQIMEEGRRTAGQFKPIGVLLQAREEGYGRVLRS